MIAFVLSSLFVMGRSHTPHPLLPLTPDLSSQLPPSLLCDLFKGGFWGVACFLTGPQGGLSERRETDRLDRVPLCPNVRQNGEETEAPF